MVLKPLFTKHLPRLYPGVIDKIFFHHDKATSHTSDLAINYLEKLKSDIGISYIEKKNLPVKYPDRSPLDFFLALVT